MEEIPPAREFSESDSLNRELIHDASDFETLYETLRQIGVIRGTGKDYSPEKLIEKIEGVRQGTVDIGYITRTFGLRDKVEELMRLK